ncbi:hypothetical protein Cadr_000024818 [Camelus dromedarius]|uniref:Uncharacterized protein n=1 Tax=Camelus dromedarius TaxID=9838 RepID=A0A5N4CQF1_CAMDR|nr:hypothetical protein Cadr_000024818 [Camelus dromedarius]
MGRGRQDESVSLILTTKIPGSGTGAGGSGHQRECTFCGPEQGRRAGHKFSSGGEAVAELSPPTQLTGATAVTAWLQHSIHTTLPRNDTRAEQSHKPQDRRAASPSVYPQDPAPPPDGKNEGGWGNQPDLDSLMEKALPSVSLCRIPAKTALQKIPSVWPWLWASPRRAEVEPEEGPRAQRWLAARNLKEGVKKAGLMATETELCLSRKSGTSSQKDWTGVVSWRGSCSPPGSERFLARGQDPEAAHRQKIGTSRSLARGGGASRSQLRGWRRINAAFVLSGFLGRKGVESGRGGPTAGPRCRLGMSRTVRADEGWDSAPPRGAKQPTVQRVCFWPGTTRKGEGGAIGGRWGQGRRMAQPGQTCGAGKGSPRRGSPEGRHIRLCRRARVLRVFGMGSEESVEPAEGRGVSSGGTCVYISWVPDLGGCL